MITPLTLCKISELSYENEDIFKREIHNFVDNGLIDKPANIYFYNAYESTSIDAQLYIIYYKNEMIVSVRGTSSKRDIISDLYIFKKKFLDVEQINYHKKCGNYKNMKVHSGFLDQYNALKMFIISNVSNLYLNLKQDKIKIHFTSHSLGAAISVLLSTLLKSQFGDKLYIINYLFGCPKIGNNDFVNYYNNVIDETYRYVYCNDIIPRLPKINYKTTKNRIILGDPHKSNWFYRFIGNVNDHSIKYYINYLKVLEDVEYLIKGETSNSYAIKKCELNGLDNTIVREIENENENENEKVNIDDIKIN